MSLSVRPSQLMRIGLTWCRAAPALILALVARKIDPPSWWRGMPKFGGSVLFLAVRIPCFFLSWEKKAPVLTLRVCTLFYF